jgi:hypothetical protein
MIEMSRSGRVPSLLSTGEAIWESPLESVVLSTLFFERYVCVCVCVYEGGEGGGARGKSCSRGIER